MLLLFLVGCDTGTSSAPVSLPVCTPLVDNANIYRNPPQTTAYYIYQYSQNQSLTALTGATLTAMPSTEQLQAMMTSSADFDPQKLPAAKHEAFLLLEDQVRTWSNHADVLVDDNLLVRITITFVSPQLIESITLNRIFFSGIPATDFQAAVNEREVDIAKRDEILFLVTVTASEYHEKLVPNDPLVVDLSTGNMELTSSSGVSVTSPHTDGHMIYPINLRSEPEHGYMAYPIAVTANGTCNWLLDPNWNTTLTIHALNLFVNQKQYGPLTWNIDYHSLVEVNMPNQKLPAFAPPPAGFENIYSPTDKIPSPVNGMTKSDTNYWNGYWEEMARYVWFHLTNIKPP